MLQSQGTNSVVGHMSAQVNEVMKILEEDEWAETVF